MSRGSTRHRDGDRTVSRQLQVRDFTSSERILGPRLQIESTVVVPSGPVVSERQQSSVLAG